METILIILTGTLMGALFTGFYLLGYHFGSRKEEDGVKVTEENKDFLRELMEWRNYQ